MTELTIRLQYNHQKGQKDLLNVEQLRGHGVLHLDDIGEVAVGHVPICSAAAAGGDRTGQDPPTT